MVTDKSKYYAAVNGINHYECAPTQIASGLVLTGSHAAAILAIADNDVGFLAWIDNGQCKAIDLAADAARLRLVSPGQWIDQEYLMAFEDATAFKAAGYTGEAPGGVSTWAIAEGWTDQQAADDIIYQKALWKASNDQIRGIRLLGKSTCRAATTAAAKWAAAQSAITQLNALFI